MPDNLPENNLLSPEKSGIIANLIPDIIAEVNLDKIYTWLNKAGLDFFGDNAIGKEASEFFAEEQNTYNKVAPLFEGSDEVVYVESWQKRKDGEKRLIAWYCKSLKDETGKVLGVLSAGHDITRRHLREEKIKYDEAQLHNAMTLAHLGPWEYEVSKDEFTFNDTFYSLFHTSAEKVGGYNLSSKEYIEKFVFPDDVPLIENEVKKAIETPDPDYTNEIRHRIKYADGSIGYLLVRFFIVKDNSTGKTVKAYGISQDITFQVNLIKKNNDSLVFLQNIIDLIPVRIFWKDKNLKYLGCNQAFANDAGKKSPSELIDKDDFEMGWKEQAEAYRKDDTKVIESGLPKINYEEEQTTPDGKKIWLLTNKIPLKNNSTGGVIGILGTYIDITESKTAADNLKRAFNETQKMNELMIDRELKMVEFKKRIEELEAQLRSSGS